ncbi:MAG: hypothetical protein AB2556_19500, partial [Candidatus Thiodiazotropha sp.]
MDPRKDGAEINSPRDHLRFAILETFLDWLDGRGVQVVCCGDQGQPPQIAEEMPHDWLRRRADYYEEVLADHRAKEPALKAFKKEDPSPARPGEVPCHEPSAAGLPWVGQIRGSLEAGGLDLPDLHVPLLYRPKVTRRQNIMVSIPGPLVVDGRPDRQELVLSDVVEVSWQTAHEVLDGLWGQDWALGYAITVHSSQGLTIADTQKVWIIDDFLQWSNLAYLAVSRVEYMHQLERVVCHQEEGSEGPPIFTEQQLRKVVAKKLVAHKRQDQAKGLRFNLKIGQILERKEAQNNHCAACDIELLWAYQPKDTQQFSVD